MNRRSMMALAIAAFSACGPDLDQNKFLISVDQKELTVRPNVALEVGLTLKRTGFNGPVMIVPPNNDGARLTFSVSPNPIPSGVSKATLTLHWDGQAYANMGTGFNVTAYDAARKAPVPVDVYDGIFIKFMP